MKDNQMKELDNERLEFATDLLRGLWADKRNLDTPIPFIRDFLNVMEFGSLSMQELKDYIESTGQV